MANPEHIDGLGPDAAAPVIIRPPENFQREVDYRLCAFAKFAGRLEGDRVLLYGSGANVRHILEGDRPFEIAGVADDKNVGATVSGQMVCTLEEGLSREPSCMVIAAEFSSILHVYRHVVDACDKAGVRIFDMYGNDVSMLVGRVEREASRCPLQLQLGRIGSADVISTNAELLFCDHYDTPPGGRQLIAQNPRELTSLLAYAACLGKEIVFMSDNPKTTSEALAKRLAQLGFDRSYEAILHTETGLWSFNGHFRLLELSHPGKHILHIGLYRGADGFVPESYGFIDTLLVYSHPLSQRRLRDSIYPTGWEQALASIGNGPVTVEPWWQSEAGQGPNSAEPAFRSCAQQLLGADGSRVHDPATVLAPLIAGFVTWLAERLHEGQHEYDAVLFPSRDGCIVKKVYDIYREVCDSNLPPSIYLYASRSAATAAAGQGAGSRHRQNYLTYLAHEGLALGKHYALVDFVSAGTLQDLLCSFVPFELQGFYFGSRLGTEVARENSAFCYFQDDDADFLLRYLDLEPFMSSMEPSLAGFDESGSPLFKNEVRTDAELTKLTRAHDEVLRFAQLCFTNGKLCHTSVDPGFLNGLMPALDQCDRSVMSLHDDFRGNAIFNPFTGEKVADAEPVGTSAEVEHAAAQRSVHEVLLDMLGVFDRVCTANGLHYIATHGTLLGAVRHGGFVPWDNDLDVAMPRADYDRLAELAAAGAFPEPYFLQTPESDPGCFYGGYAKLRDSSTTAIEPYAEGSTSNQGMWMDIMPLDNRPHSDATTKQHLRYHVRTWQRALYAQTYGIRRMGNTSPKKLSFYFMLADRYDRNQLCKHLRNACTSYRTTGELTIFAGNYDINRDGVRYQASDVKAAKRMPFEGTTIPILRNAEAWLENYYGPDWESPNEADETGRGTGSLLVLDPNVPYAEYIERDADDKDAGAVSAENVVGFTAGVFDLLHVGHLNLLEAARAQCGYLRVGVISDEVCEALKHKTPVIPLEERMRLVDALECVDEVVAITDVALTSKVEAWSKWPFNVAFSGDDHADDPYWQREAAALADLGARIEFLPYTKSVSTSTLREQLSEGSDLL